MDRAEGVNASPFFKPALSEVTTLVFAISPPSIYYR
jgi:hypothetical protein